MKRFLLVLILFLPTNLCAETAVGVLFNCEEGIIKATKSGKVATEKKALKKYKRFIKRKTRIIRISAKGSKARKNALAARKAARASVKAIRSCTSVGSSFNGTWIIVTENGSTPSELGYTSLELTISGQEFSSVFTSPSVSCSWKGTVLIDDTTIYVSTDSASGPPCSQAVGNSALGVHSLEGDTLTIDYTGSGTGTLQVFARK